MAYDIMEIYQKFIGNKIKRHYINKPIQSTTRIMYAKYDDEEDAIMVYLKYTPDEYDRLILTKKMCSKLYNGDKEAQKYFFNKLDVALYEMLNDEVIA